MHTFSQIQNHLLYPPLIIMSRVSTPEFSSVASNSGTNYEGDSAELLRNFSIYHQGKSSVFDRIGMTPVESFVSSYLTAPISGYNSSYARKLAAQTTSSFQSLMAASLSNIPLMDTPLTAPLDTSDSRLPKSISRTFFRSKSIFRSRQGRTKPAAYSTKEFLDEKVSCEDIYNTYIDLFETVNRYDELTF